jgi:hypothetical protein
MNFKESCDRIICLRDERWLIALELGQAGITGTKVRDCTLRVSIGETAARIQPNGQNP